MKWTGLVLFALACGDATGTSGECAFGGALTDCPDAERTPEAACWRLVECGALPVEAEDQFEDDWGSCADQIATRTEDRQRLVINCIATSTCDELRVETRNDLDESYCFELTQ